jgi:hypothetical protein
LAETTDRITGTSTKLNSSAASGRSATAVAAAAIASTT